MRLNVGCRSRRHKSSLPMKRLYPTLAALCLSLPVILPAQTNWNVQNSGTLDILHGVAFANGQYMVVGTNTAQGTALTSPDGIDWTHHLSGVGGIFYDVAYGNGQWVAVGTNSANSIAATSTNGASWSGGPAGVGLEFRGVTWTGGEFVAVGGTGGNAVIATSSNGSSWSGGAIGVTSTLKAVDQDGTTRVAVGTTGAIVYSIGGGSWTQAMGTPNVDWEDVTFSSGQFVVVGAGGVLMTSTDGVNWTLGNSGTGDILYSIAAANSPQVGVATGTNGRIITSPDAINWSTVLPAPTGDILYGVAHGTAGGGRFVAVGTNGRILTSDFSSGGGGPDPQFIDDVIQAPSNGGSFTAAVTAGAGVNWTVTENETWVSLSNASGTGNGQVNIFVSFNSSAQGRTGTLAVGADTLTISQAGAPLNAPNLNGFYNTSTDEVDLNWSRINAASGYELERRISPDGPFSQIQVFSGSSSNRYSDNTINPGTRYDYRVRAIAGSLASEWSNIRTVGAPPAIPDDLEATPRNASQIELTWTDVSGEDGYLIFRAANDETFFSQIARLGPDESRYIDAGLAPSSRYRYQIEAESDVFGRRSDEAPATTLVETRTIVWESSDFSLSSYFGVAHGNGVTVAVGTDGRITTSSDFLSWSEQTPVTAEDLQDLVFAQSRFVAVGDGGVVVTSPDGTTWIVQSSGTGEDLVAVAFAFNGWYAVGSDGALLTSPDAVSWTEISASPALTGFVDIFAGPALVAIENTGRFLTSSDGTNWIETRPDAPSDATEPFFWTRTAGAHGANIDSVVGPNSHLSHSPDATTWTEGNDFDFNYFQDVAYGTDRFLAVGINGRTGYSFSGQSYIDAPGGETSFNAVTWASDRFVAVGSRAYIATTPDGLSWTTVQDPEGTEANLDTVGGGGGQLIIFGETDFDGVALRNAFDGNGWIEQTLSVPGISFATRINDVTFLDGQLVAVGDEGVILTSPDGETWTTRRTQGPGPFNDNLSAVVFGNNRLLVGGGDDPLIESTDGGLTWVPVPDLPNQFTPREMTAGPRFVAHFGSSNIFRLWYSDNATDWEIANVNGQVRNGGELALGTLDDEPLHVILGNNFSGDEPDAALSWDGRNWNSTAPLPVDGRPSAMAYGAGVFVAAGRSGSYLWASLDGATWEPAPAGFLPQEVDFFGGFWDLAFYEGTFFGIGTAGLIVELGIRASDFTPPVQTPEAPRVEITVTGADATLRFRTEVGFSYQLLGGPSPASMSPDGTAISGTGSEVELQRSAPANATRWFWQIEITPE